MLNDDAVSRSVYDEIVEFIKGFRDATGAYRYREQVEMLKVNDARSITIDHNDLAMHSQEMVSRLARDPRGMIREFNNAVYEVLREIDAGYADSIRDELMVRISNYPYQVKMRDIDADLIGRMISTAGMVVRASEVKPFISRYYYRCANGHDGYISRVDYHRGRRGGFARSTGNDAREDDRGEKGSERRLVCKKCGEEISVEIERSRFSNMQMIRMQELPEDLPPGQLPYHIDVILVHDLVDYARPGDRIILTGIVDVERDVEGSRLDVPLFRIRIEGNNIEFLASREGNKDGGARSNGRFVISEDDEREIRRLASRPEVYSMLISSFAPHIYGHEIIKEAILLQIVGSPQRELEDSTKLRGDINILLVGDPGTAKSELLKYAARIAPRGLYTSGRGSTAAGLTAAVIRDKSGMMMLEAGAVVLGDQGLVCITEDTEIYTGDALVQVGRLWERIDGMVYMTRSGREAKQELVPVTIYDGSSEGDISGYAFAIMRRWYSGEIVKITFASGLTLKVTPEHLLMLASRKRRWIRACDIKSGERLRSPTRVFKPTYTLNVSPDEAYVIGCVYGDGYINTYSITISQSKANRDVVDNIQTRASGVFSLYDKGERVREVNGYMLVSRMLQLYTSDKAMLRKTRLLIRNPSIDDVLMLSDDALWAFLAGIFDTDGDVNMVHGKAYSARLYPTHSEHELKVLLYALRRLGIYARIHEVDGLPMIQITGRDLVNFLEGIRGYSTKVKRIPVESIVVDRKSPKRGVERVVSVETMHYEGYVYDLSVGKYHNYEAALVYIHNCIDELDKMRAEDRSALHEVMEQQTCSVAKGGIVATLNARTSILAAANPILGKYDPYRNITENVNLPIPLLTRFDLIFAIRDEPSKDGDANLARHILGIHRRIGYEHLPPIPIDLLRKYLAYAKRFNPVLSKEAEDRIFEYYMQMRANASPDAITITARQLEALIRLATARARLMLRSVVTAEDAERAIYIFNVMLNKVGIDVKTGKVDLGVLHGMPSSERSKMQLFLDVFSALSGKDQNPVEEQALIAELVKTGKFTEDEAREWIRKANANGMIYEVRQGFYKRA
ncbi:MAG: hypothetical protein NZ888_08145 [Candidatus Nitrosocaldus sp.]|nr:hypothetical protein [Candidatus Nitrosocaldus sp.]